MLGVLTSQVAVCTCFPSLPVWLIKVKEDGILRQNDIPCSSRLEIREAQWQVSQYEVVCLIKTLDCRSWTEKFSSLSQFTEWYWFFVSYLAFLSVLWFPFLFTAVAILASCTISKVYWCVVTCSSSISVDEIFCKRRLRVIIAVLLLV